MMRTRDRVGVAVRHEDTGAILTDAFSVQPLRYRWARWPLARGVVALHAALATGKRAIAVSEEMRWSEEVTGEQAEEAEEIGFWGKVLVGLSALLGVAVQVAAVRIAPVVIAKEAGLTGAAFIVTDAAVRLSILLLTLWVLSRFKPFRHILGYHGAEHKTIAAFEAGRPLTASQAAGFSRFHPRCGTSFLVVSAVVSIAVYGAVLAITGIFTYLALITTRIVGAPLVTAISFELQRQAAKRAHGRWSFLSAPGMLAQRLTTAEPDDEELEVACAALQVALEPAADLSPEAAREGAVPPVPAAQPSTAT
jgi:uncharacterized protein YqhQ